MHTTSASAPCTPPRNSHGAGTSGISIIDGGDGSSSMDLDSACTLTVAGVQRSAALAPRPSTSACSHSFSAGNDDGDQSASDSEHSARTSLSASSSPFMSLPRSFSPVDAHAIQAPIPASSDSPSSLSNEDHVAPADSTDTPPANATLTSPSISPALSQLPPTVLHELIASATSNLYIRGLPTHISDSHLFSLCSPHGHVLSAKSIVDLRTGQCKGYGFVLFARPHDAVAAMLFINKNPFVLSGPGLQASMARESFSAKLKVLQDDESANVYLSNLPLEMDEQGLVELIKPVHALSLRILVGPTGVSRGVGFARLANRDAASQVIAKLNRLTLQPGLPPLQVRFADSPAQKMLKAVTCPPPPRKGPPGPARPCAGEMPPRPPAPARSKSHPEPPVPWTQRGRMGLAPPARRIKREAASEAGSNEYANGSPSAVARSVVQSVMGSGRTSGAASVPRPSHGHGHGRHASMSGTWEKSVGNQQERGRTMHRRMQPVAALPSAHFQSEQLGAPNTHTIGTSTHNPLPTNPPTHQPPGMYFVPTPSTHDPSTGYPLPMPLPLPMTLIPPHAPDAPPMYFVAMDPSRTTLPNSTPCHIAYAAVDQYGQPLMTWAMPCAAITAPLPPAIPIPPATVAAPLSPVASPVAPPMSPPALAPWSAEANVVSSPPVGPPVLTSASSMDELTLPSMSEVTGGMTSVKEEACGAVDEQMVTKPRAKSFSVSMLMNAGGAEQAARPGV